MSLKSYWAQVIGVTPEGEIQQQAVFATSDFSEAIEPYLQEFGWSELVGETEKSPEGQFAGGSGSREDPMLQVKFLATA